MFSFFNFQLSINFLCSFLKTKKNKLFAIYCQAYVWGFDIRNWQRHLNPLTWPEILRQFALSAGFGPQLKKHNIEQVHPSNNEVISMYSIHR